MGLERKQTYFDFHLLDLLVSETLANPLPLSRGREEKKGEKKKKEAKTLRCFLEH